MTGGFRNPATGALALKAKLGIGLALLIALGIALASAYFVGYGKGKNLSELAVSSYQTKVANLERDLVIEQHKIKERVVTEYITQVAYQDKIVYRNRDVIRAAIPQVPKDQTLSKGFIYVHNQSAKILPIDFNLASDITPSGVQNTTLLDTVARNYAIASRNKAKLDALQKYVKETYEASKKVADEN